jgi:hypothetical protein
MATPKALNALQKTKEALDDIKSKLEPVIQRLKDDAFERATAQAQATVSLSIGMMKYMGARLQGLDDGKKSDDPLRKELNQMRKVLAEIKARHTEAKKSQPRAKKGESSNGDQKQKSSDAKKTSIAKQLLTKKKSNESQSPTNKDGKSDSEVIKADDLNQRNNNKRNADNSKRRTKKRRST